MMHVSRTKKRHSRVIAIAGSGSVLATLLMAQRHLSEVEAASREPAPMSETAEVAWLPSEADAKNAFLAAYDVFMHPRCMNCHPAGDAPLQGDDSRPHAQNVQRGPDGKGLYAMKCANCHQDANLPGLNMPPGNPNWHLLPPETPMVFQGKSPRELALQMADPKQNGGKDLRALLHHMEHDSLVLWGWNPGDGRTTPTLTHEQFARHIKTWIEGGAPAPD
jgi:mono/diheme cytochrome c family protein